MDKIIENIKWPSLLGKPKKQDNLFGMGLGRAYEVEFQDFAAIVKVSPSKKEKEFYEFLAPRLNLAGVDTPILYWSTSISDNNLIVLEKINSTLPKERWRADEQVLQFLAKMHELKIPLTEMKLNPDVWTQQMNVSCRKFFKPSDQDFVFDLFEGLRNQYQHLFEPSHLVSGDPSGRNWGVRENGDLVLFDWERVGVGTSTLDLMGVAFGEPNDEVFLEIARLYLKHRSNLKILEGELARETQVARVHIAAVMLDIHAKGKGHLSKKVYPYFQKQFPSWLRNTFL